MCISHAPFEANNIHGAITHLRDRAKALALFALLERDAQKAQDNRAASLCHTSWQQCRELLKDGKQKAVLEILASHNITLKQPKGQVA